MNYFFSCCLNAPTMCNYPSVIHYSITVALFCRLASNKKTKPRLFPIPIFLPKCFLPSGHLRRGRVVFPVFKYLTARASEKQMTLRLWSISKIFPKGWPVHWLTETVQSDVAMRGMSAKTVGCTLIMERDCATRLTGLTLFKSNQLLVILIMDERTQEQNQL